MKAEQDRVVTRLALAARANQLEFLLEIIPSKVGAVNDETVATLIRHYYALGVFPDWWKLEPMQTEAGWANASAAIAEHDPYCRGIVILGLEAPIDDLSRSFRAAAAFPLVKGFAVGRSVFGDVARRWFAGTVSDADAIAAMADTYRTLCAVWDEARTSATGAKP
jgi:5-dehydro-2-deoxygluconokinase